MKYRLLIQHLLYCHPTWGNLKINTWFHSILIWLMWWNSIISIYLILFLIMINAEWHCSLKCDICILVTVYCTQNLVVLTVWLLLDYKLLKKYNGFYEYDAVLQCDEQNHQWLVVHRIQWCITADLQWINYIVHYWNPKYVLLISIFYILIIPYRP